MKRKHFFRKLFPILFIAFVIFPLNLNAQLIAHWKFNNNGNDETGNYNASLMNGAGYSTENMEGTYSLNLDGTDDYANCGAIDLGEAFTITLWIKLTNSWDNIKTILSNCNSGLSDGFKIFINNPWGTDAHGQIWLETGDGTDDSEVTSTTGIVTIDQWNHIAITADKTGNTGHIYFNGSDVTLTSSIPVDFNTNKTLNIGRMVNGNSYFQGNLDDVRIYNRVLTSTEINTVMNGGDIGGNPANYTLTTGTSGSGTVDPASGTYTENTQVTIEATPASGYEFDHWEGDAFGSTNPLTITMNASKSITAVFTETGGSSSTSSVWTDGTVGIYYDGHVGIGTTSLDAMLTVNGDIKATRINVVSSITSDFVFDKNYNLLNLEELEKYVSTHKHLPEIPSAGELKKTGYNMGEMDDLLLRKIEELTLYIIELQKEVDQLQEKLKESENGNY